MRRQSRFFLLALSFALGIIAICTAPAREPQRDRFTTIDFPGATRTNPRWVNPEGEIAGFYVAGGTTHGFLRSKDGECYSNLMELIEWRRCKGWLRL